jgi:hypothetical protein
MKRDSVARRARIQRLAGMHEIELLYISSPGPDVPTRYVFRNRVCLGAIDALDYILEVMGEKRPWERKTDEN